MRRTLNGPHALEIPRPQEHRAVVAAVAGGGTIEQAELHRVHADLLAQLVDERLSREGGLGRAGSAVSRGLRHVDHDVVGVDADVGHAVAGENADHGRRDGGARVGARHVADVGGRGGDHALVVDAHLHRDLPAGSGSGGVKHRPAVHDDFHWASGLAGEDRGDGFEVDVDLPAEPAPNLHRHDLDVGQGTPQDARGGGADAEGALGARPDCDLSVGRPIGRAVLWLDVALVGARDGVCALDDCGGSGEGSLGVAVLHPLELSDVGVRRLLAEVIPDKVLVDDHGIVRHGVLEGNDGREHLVIDLDELQRLERRVLVHRRDGRDRMSLIDSLVLGHDALAGELGVGGFLPKIEHLRFGLGQIGAGHHGGYAGRSLRLRRVDPRNPGVGVGAAQHCAVQQSRELDVGAEQRTAQDLVHAVVPDRPGAYDFELRLRAFGRGHSRTPYSLGPARWSRFVAPGPT